MNDEPPRKPAATGYYPDTPAIPVKPPYLYLSALTAGLALDCLLGLDFLGLPAQMLCGVPLLVAGMILMNAAMAAFARAETPVATDRPTRRLVMYGPFSRTRNPVYIALTLIYAGLSVMFDAPMALLSLAPLLWFMDRRVIPAEEAYLLAKFGEPYRAYLARVRRWL